VAETRLRTLCTQAGIFHTSTSRRPFGCTPNVRRKLAPLCELDHANWERVARRPASSVFQRRNVNLLISVLPRVKLFTADGACAGCARFMAPPMDGHTRPTRGVIYRRTMPNEFVSYSFLLAVTVAGLGLLMLAFS
jgi:hypothetical protein